MGPWGIAAVIGIAACATETGRNYLRSLLKSGVRAGYHAKEAARELVDQAKESSSELVEEVKAEREACEAEVRKEKKKAKAES